MGPRESTDPLYQAMVAAFVADKRNRVVPAYGIRRRRILLDTALVEFPLDIKGDFVYCDFNSTGVAEASLNNTSEDAFPLLALAGVENIPYDNVFISCAAQPGLFLNLWYGYGSQFISPTSAIATIGSITNPVRIEATNGDDIVMVTKDGIYVDQKQLPVSDAGYGYGTSFTSLAAQAANTPQNIIAAVSNVDGYILGDAQYISRNGASGYFSILAKATAPTAVGDGDVFAIGLFSATGAQIGRVSRSVQVASGKRLDRIAGTLETDACVMANYTLKP